MTLSGYWLSIAHLIFKLKNVAGLMKESEGRISYLKEICYTQIHLRRILHLRRRQYVGIMTYSCAFILRRSMRSCLEPLSLNIEPVKDFKSLRFETWMALNYYWHLPLFSMLEKYKLFGGAFCYLHFLSGFYRVVECW